MIGAPSKAASASMLKPVLPFRVKQQDESVTPLTLPPRVLRGYVRLAKWGSYATHDTTNDHEKSQKRQSHAVCVVANFLSAIEPTIDNLREVCDVVHGLHLLTFYYHHFNVEVRRGQGTFDHLFVGEKFGEYANGLADRLSTWFEKKGRPEPRMWKEDLWKALLKHPSEFGTATKRGQALKAVFEHWQSPCGLRTIPRWREALELIRRSIPRVDLELRSSSDPRSSIASASSGGHDGAVHDDVKRPAAGVLQSAKSKKPKSRAASATSEGGRMSEDSSDVGEAVQPDRLTIFPNQFTH